VSGRTNAVPNAAGIRPTGDDAADELLNTNWLALMIGMLLDQQIAIELAFMGPLRLQQRLERRGLALDAASIASLPVDELSEVFSEKPALHRFPQSMAKRTHSLCVAVTARFQDDVEALWRGEQNGLAVVTQLKSLPGFGPEKSKIFLAMLVKRFGVEIDGWKTAAGAFADEIPRSVADVDNPDVLYSIREYRKQLREFGKRKDG
jgi:uncharacterized HhH-GPD family protein